MTVPGWLRMHGFEPFSAANGPGTRAVIWVQGCTLSCPGCFNPETHARAGEEVEEVEVAELYDRVAGLADRVEGVTITGGEPLQQRGAVLELLRRIRGGTGLSTILFTGYDWPEVRRMRELDELRRCVDVLLAGRYREDRRVASGLRGSDNKTVRLFSERYTRADLDAVPEAEVIVRPDGRVTLTGIDPPTGW
ncbi:4Fe-4S single cluster domain-containing protein [Streptomyces synnematoformans]|uniref:Anaerobic ribonucleoside-triphosphate reductase-activating protein n=1 Tax=Streptomyces synnematoformans TaxID=415721 RepID=A0ABN2XAA4_9ACTN